MIYTNKLLWYDADETTYGRWNLGTNRSYIKVQWDRLLASLDNQLEVCFFRDPRDIRTGDKRRLRRLVDSKITWISCDIAWILEELTHEETITLETGQSLLRKLKRWCGKAWPAYQYRRNPTMSKGYYDHLPLLLVRSTQPSALARTLESVLFDLLRDLNLSYERGEDVVYSNELAQGSAFRRFAAAFEDILEDIAENDLHSNGAGLHQQMAFLNLDEKAAV